MLRKLMREQIEGVVICPSNPYVSIAPILSVREIREWLRKRDFPVVAVSPIVGGAALKGPAAKMMCELDAEASALGVARHYGDQVDGWVIDQVDAHLATTIAAAGPRVICTDTIMKNRAKSVALARRVITFTRSLY